MQEGSGHDNGGEHTDQNTQCKCQRRNPSQLKHQSALPNQNRITQVMRVEILESRIEVQARFQPRSIAVRRLRPASSSSLRRSKIRMFASTAIPILRTKPAIPGKVRVTGMSLKSECCQSINKQGQIRHDARYAIIERHEEHHDGRDR